MLRISSIKHYTCFLLFWRALGKTNKAIWETEWDKNMNKKIGVGIALVAVIVVAIVLYMSLRFQIT